MGTTGFSDDVPPGSIAMKLINNAGAPIELFWIDTYEGPTKGNLIPQLPKPLRNNTDVQINSYETHQFKVRFLKHREGVEVNIIKGPKEERVEILYNETADALYLKQTTKLNEIMDQIKSATDQCESFRGEEFSSCISSEIIDEVTRITDSKSQLSKYRDLISSRLRNYTCLDETLETTTPLSTYEIQIQGNPFNVNILLDMPNAKIWYVDDFISEDECQVLMNHGRPRLARATVSAEDGTSTVSEHRKAQQASYDLHKVNFESDPLWPLYTRAMDLVNYHAGYQLEPDGQEAFTIIQYNPTDQYTPHCDGTCDSSLHVPTGRVATAVLYCKVPEIGGATTFTKADVFVKPKAGMATFFSYKGPDGRMDEGFTEHSGCPVIKGEKWITTLWMRDGVSNEHPWSMYDPSGIAIFNEAEDTEYPTGNDHSEL